MSLGVPWLMPVVRGFPRVSGDEPPVEIGIR